MVALSPLRVSRLSRALDAVPTYRTLGERSNLGNLGASTAISRKLYRKDRKHALDALIHQQK